MIPQIRAGGTWLLVLGIWLCIRDATILLTASSVPCERTRTNYQLLTTKYQIPVPQHHSLDHTSLGFLDEAQQHGHVFTLIALGLELLDGLRSVEFGVEQHAEGVV